MIREAVGKVIQTETVEQQSWGQRPFGPHWGLELTTSKHILIPGVLVRSRRIRQTSGFII